MLLLLSLRMLLLKKNFTKILAVDLNQASFTSLAVAVKHDRLIVAVSH
jgi:hypothetical protein